ncbi:MAG: hypothetical protein COA78_25035 [Blastopirellula sp.]|nr:MAG: hypothetical protein COA78_25035 [Blastopirellula sp.]
MLSNKGPKATERTTQLLRQYDLDKHAKGNHRLALAGLAEEIALDPDAEKIYAFSELAYVAAKRADAMQQKASALELYASSAAHAYYYLFDERFANEGESYDPQFRQACDLYNGSLEGALRIVSSQGKLKPGSTYRISTPHHDFQIEFTMNGNWSTEDFEEFEFASDFSVKGLKNQHRTYGLGVPLIAKCKDQLDDPIRQKYFPPNLTYPMTAFLHVSQENQKIGADCNPVHICKIELYDPLEITELEVAGKMVPLESDISTPLAYYWGGANKVDSMALATLGLFNPGSEEGIKGMYMLEPYDPKKIPVVMVHGLWSSPATWLEMFNDLRAQPEIQKNYQFWFYLYPTGEPFWISANRLRKDLDTLQQDLDPMNQAMALDQMVLVGHSMGGLLSRMQTIESENDFWNLVSDRDPRELQGTPEDKQGLLDTLFFKPSGSIRKVVTLGTPHRGSEYANGTTRWLGRSFITLPDFFVGRKQRLLEDNPGYFQDTDLLKINTSVDSLAPDSPMLAKILEAPKAPWVDYHTVIGIVDQDSWFGWFSGNSDGVVGYESARLDEAKSERIVTSDHSNIHRHPRSVLEVRRILLEHAGELRQEYIAARQHEQIQFQQQNLRYQNQLDQSGYTLPAGHQQMYGYPASDAQRAIYQPREAVQNGGPWNSLSK